MVDSFFAVIANLSYSREVASICVLWSVHLFSIMWRGTLELAVEYGYLRQKCLIMGVILRYTIMTNKIQHSNCLE